MLPVSIITGFLGSGKTTLLNHLLRHDALKNSLVIINEFGEIGIDHLIVSAPAENLRLLANGCLCCEVRGALFETLTDVTRKRANGEIPSFDRILIETTGLADPVPIVRTIVSDRVLSPLYRLENVVGVVAAVHGLSQLAAHDEARKQIAVADVLVLSKIDLVAPVARHEIEAALVGINRGAELLRARHGEIDPERLFRQCVADGGTHDLARWLRADQASTLAAGDHSLHPRHAADIRTFTLAYDSPVSRHGLATWLSMLASFKGPQLLRVKGIVNVGGQPFVVNVVQTVIHDPMPLERWPTSDERTRFVFIGRDLERATLEASFSAFSLAESLGPTHQVDPVAYARFRGTAEHLL